MPEGRGFNTRLPRSPCFANLVVVYSAPLNIGAELPPAMPHGSFTGAKPGLRHGWYFQISWGVPSVAFLFADQYCLANVGLNGSLRVLLQWSQFEIRCP